MDRYKNIIHLLSINAFKRLIYSFLIIGSLLFSNNIPESWGAPVSSDVYEKFKLTLTIDNILIDDSDYSIEDFTLAAFHHIDGNDVCIGYVENSNVITVYGNDGSDATQQYVNIGEVPEFRLFDGNRQVILPVYIEEDFYFQGTSHPIFKTDLVGYSNCIDIPNYDVVNINLVDDIMTFDIQWEEDFSDEDEPIIPIYVNIFDFLDNITFSSVVEGFEQELTVPAEISNLIWNGSDLEYQLSIDNNCSEGISKSIEVDEPIPDSVILTKTEVFDYNSIFIEWDESYYAKTYNIERSLDLINWEVIAEDISDTFYNDLLLSADTDYYYQVFAVNSQNEFSDSAQSDNIKTESIMLVENIRIEGGDSRVLLDWDFVPDYGGVSNSYKVFEVDELGELTLHKTLSSNHTHINLEYIPEFHNSPDSKDYCFVIQASNIYGESDYSELVCTKIDGPVGSDLDWGIQIVANISNSWYGEHHDKYNILGFKKESVDGYDASDLPEQDFHLGSYISLYFPHSDWNSELSGGNQFTSDIKYEYDDSLYGYNEFEGRYSLNNEKNWNLEFLSNIDGHVTLTFYLFSKSHDDNGNILDFFGSEAINTPFFLFDNNNNGQYDEDEYIRIHDGLRYDFNQVLNRDTAVDFSISVGNALPEEPQNFNAILLENESRAVSLSWEDGCCMDEVRPYNATSYDIEVVNQYNNIEQYIMNYTNTNIVIKGLKYPNTEYTFNIQSRNPSGLSPDISTSNSVVTLQNQVPIVEAGNSIVLYDINNDGLISFEIPQKIVYNNGESNYSSLIAQNLTHDPDNYFNYNVDNWQDGEFYLSDSLSYVWEDSLGNVLADNPIVQISHEINNSNESATYRLRVNDNNECSFGCEDFDEVEILFKQKPAPAVIKKEQINLDPNLYFIDLNWASSEYSGDPYADLNLNNVFDENEPFVDIDNNGIFDEGMPPFLGFDSNFYSENEGIENNIFDYKRLASYYELFLYDDNGSWTNIGTSNATYFKYDVFPDDFEIGREYCFKIASYNDLGITDVASDSVCVNTPDVPQVQIVSPNLNDIVQYNRNIDIDLTFNNIELIEKLTINIFNQNNEQIYSNDFSAPSNVSKQYSINLPDPGAFTYLQESNPELIYIEAQVHHLDAPNNEFSMHVSEPFSIASNLQYAQFNPYSYYLVSIPIQYDANIVDLFKDANSYGELNYFYEQNDIINLNNLTSASDAPAFGKGYVLRTQYNTDSNHSFIYEGDVLSEYQLPIDYSYDVDSDNDGWNLIPYPLVKSMHLKDIFIYNSNNGEMLSWNAAADLGWIASTLVGFESDKAIFVPCQELQPFRSYWMQSFSDNLEIIFNPNLLGQDLKSNQLWTFDLFINNEGVPNKTIFGDFITIGLKDDISSKDIKWGEDDLSLSSGKRFEELGLANQVNLFMDINSDEGNYHKEIKYLRDSESIDWNVDIKFENMCSDCRDLTFSWSQSKVDDLIEKMYNIAVSNGWNDDTLSEFSFQFINYLGETVDQINLLDEQWDNCDTCSYSINTNDNNYGEGSQDIALKISLKRDGLLGCTNPLSCNYMPSASIHDESLCDYAECTGCMDLLASNYDHNATIPIDDESSNKFCKFDGQAIIVDSYPFNSLNPENYIATENVIYEWDNTSSFIIDNPISDYSIEYKNHIPIKIKNYSENSIIEGIELTIEYDENIIDYIEINQSIPEEIYNMQFNDIDEGKLIISFTCAPISDEDVLCDISGEIELVDLNPVLKNINFSENHFTSLLISSATINEVSSIENPEDIFTNKSTFKLLKGVIDVGGEIEYFRQSYDNESIVFISDTDMDILGFSEYIGNTEVEDQYKNRTSYTTQEDGTYILKVLRGFHESKLNENEFLLTLDRNASDNSGISSVDASRIARYAIGLYTEDDLLNDGYIDKFHFEKSANVTLDIGPDGSDRITSTDASRVARYSLGLIETMQYCRDYKSQISCESILGCEWKIEDLSSKCSEQVPGEYPSRNWVFDLAENEEDVSLSNGLLSKDNENCFEILDEMLCTQNQDCWWDDSFSSGETIYYYNYEECINNNLIWDDSIESCFDDFNNNSIYDDKVDVCIAKIQDSQIKIENLIEDKNINLSAYRLGDVNGSWATTQSSLSKYSENERKYSYQLDELSIGDIFNVTIESDENCYIEGIDLKLGYNEEIFKINDIEINNTTLSSNNYTALINKQDENVLKLMIYAHNNIVESNQGLINIKFEIISENFESSEIELYKFQINGISSNGGLKIIDNDGYYDMISIENGILIQKPQAFKIHNAYPNPFNPSTSIIYDVKDNSNINISVYDIQGRLVETLIDSFVDSGYYEMSWDASGYSTGIYFIRMVAPSYNQTKKVMFIK